MHGKCERTRHDRANRPVGNALRELKIGSKDRTSEARPSNKNGNSKVEVRIKVARKARYLDTADFFGKVRNGVNPGNETIGHFIQSAEQLFTNDFLGDGLFHIAERVSGNLFGVQMRQPAPMALLIFVLTHTRVTADVGD